MQQEAKAFTRKGLLCDGIGKMAFTADCKSDAKKLTVLFDETLDRFFFWGALMYGYRKKMFTDKEAQCLKKLFHKVSGEYEKLLH